MSPPREQILAEAKKLGFDAAGIASPGSIAKAADHLGTYLDEGCHGDMGWMVEKADRRSAPLTLWPDVKSIIMLGMNYGPSADPLTLLDHKTRANISVYARGRDYHDVVKKRLKQLGRWIHQEYGCELKVFVDTAPVMEKPLGQQAALGWQGKHTNLVSKSLGSWLFLGSIFTTLDLAPDMPETDHCGSCRQCLDICPTKAFPAPYRLDARRCISYLTIELKGQIPHEFREAIGNRIYGCDDCLAVCPWNKFAQTANEIAYQSRAELNAPRIADLMDLDDAGFRTVFSGSPIKRVGRDRFVRNVLIAAGNSREPALIPNIKKCLGDASPLVRGMAVWALGRLMLPSDFHSMKENRLPVECEPDVRAEWNMV